MHHLFMLKTTTRASALLFVWGSLMLLGSVELSADDKVGIFSVIRGEVDATHEQSSSPVPALKGADAFMNDVIRTKRRSRARLSFTDGSILNMGANHMVNVKEYAYDKEKKTRRVVLNVLRGSIRATVAKVAGDSFFEVDTPTAVISVRGTDFIVKVGPDGITTVTVIRGTVVVKNAFGTVTLQAGQQTTAKKGEAPSTPIKVSKKMMHVLTEETNVDAAMTKPGSTKTEIQQHLTQPSEQDGSASAAMIAVPEGVFQKVKTNNQQQDVINLQQKSGGNAAGWTFETPPITQTVTNLQGCPAGTTWQQSSGIPALPSLCSINGAPCAGAGSPCSQGTCIAGPPNACSAAPFGPCPTPGQACGGGICSGAIPAVPGIWACQ